MKPRSASSLDLSTGAGSDVRKLERDVAAANEGDAARQAIQLQELRAACELILSWDA
jgi:hypothetical protein